MTPDDEARFMALRQAWRTTAVETDRPLHRGN
jgi:hypothetical protein